MKTIKSRDEFVAHGINPDSPFALSERRIGDPVSLRIGDDRITRSTDGAVTRYFGYYSDSQIMVRQAWGRSLEDDIRARGNA